MEKSRFKDWAFGFGAVTSLIPAMIAADFMPGWNVLPFYGWLAIATTGAALSGVIATPYWFRGAIAGGLAGAGVMVGMWSYVALRSLLFGGDTFFKLELVIAAARGAAPGLILFAAWAGEGDGSPSDQTSAWAPTDDRRTS